MRDSTGAEYAFLPMSQMIQLILLTRSVLIQTQLMVMNAVVTTQDVETMGLHEAIERIME